jgi:RHS repeat-associated protein
MLVSENDTSPKTLHYFTDHLGSPRLITDQGGMEMGRAAYLPFGAPALAGIADSKKFTGHERDASGLDYMHARYYNWGWGRFLSVDPGRDWDQRKPQSWNAYAYVRNNPIRFTDPTGREGEDKTPKPEPQPHPVGPEGELLPPPVPLPPGKQGQPNEWVPVINPNPRPGQRPVKWKPRFPVPSPTGAQPSGSWDPEGHYDVDIPSATGGAGDRDRFLPDGTRLGPHHQPLSSSLIRLQVNAPGYAVAAFTAYAASVTELWDRMFDALNTRTRCECRAK